MVPLSEPQCDWAGPSDEPGGWQQVGGSAITQVRLRRSAETSDFGNYQEQGYAAPGFPCCPAAPHPVSLAVKPVRRDPDAPDGGPPNHL